MTVFEKTQKKSRSRVNTTQISTIRQRFFDLEIATTRSRIIRLELIFFSLPSHNNTSDLFVWIILEYIYEQVSSDSISFRVTGTILFIRNNHQQLFDVCYFSVQRLIHLQVCLIQFRILVDMCACKDVCLNIWEK